MVSKNIEAVVGEKEKIKTESSRFYSKHYLIFLGSVVAGTSIFAAGMKLGEMAMNYIQYGATNY